MAKSSIVKNHPKVSVLTPVYNTKLEYLKEAIESILNQTFTDFEFILLNDSPDNLEIEKFILNYQKKDSRIKYYKNEKNMGRPFSRNRLIELSKGEYLAIFDSDDISLPDRLEKEVKFLDEHPYIGVVSGLSNVFGDSDVADYKFPEFDLDIKIHFMGENCLVNPASMIRKSVLIDNNIRYDLSYLSSEDYKLWMDLIPYTKFHNIQEILINYRLHSGNTYKTMNMDEYLQRVYSILLEARNKYPAYWEEYKRRYCHNIPSVRIKLFGVIPFLKIKNNWLYLFDIIPVFKIKYRKLM